MRRSLPSAQWHFGRQRHFLRPRLRDSRFLIISYRLDQLERIGVMRRCEPGHLHVEFAFFLRE